MVAATSFGVRWGRMEFCHFMRTLFVTSFTPGIFEATGLPMVASFLESRTPGTLLVCHEGFPASAPFEFPGVRTYDLNTDPLLDEWLERNRDIIPDFLGGAAQECDCPNPAPFARHKSGCHWYWFNKNASKWFRKVVSLAYAARLDEPEQVVWVDADCVFKARL